MIYNIDWNVGRILNALDRQGVADETVVLFFSDHGDMCGQQGHYCGIKNLAYRGAMHVPLIVRYSTRFKPKKTEALVDVGPDMMPTILDIVGADIPGGLDGQSCLPVLDGVEAEARDAIWYQVFTRTGGNPHEFAPYGERGIRTKDWLYMRHKDQHVLLFDERADYHEQNNLVDDPAYQTLMDEFDVRIAAHMEATGDDWEMAAVFPPPDQTPALKLGNFTLALLGSFHPALTPVRKSIWGRLRKGAKSYAKHRGPVFRAFSVHRQVRYICAASNLPCSQDKGHDEFREDPMVLCPLQTVTHRGHEPFEEPPPTDFVT